MRNANAITSFEVKLFPWNVRARIVHFFTALVAAEVSDGTGRIANSLLISPDFPMVRSKTTIPAATRLIGWTANEAVAVSGGS